MNKNLIPQEMKMEKRWMNVVLRQTEQKDGSIKTSKLPVNANNTGRTASCSDQNTWGYFDEACRNIGSMATAYGSPCEIIGIGFALGDGWAGIDIDGGAGHGKGDVSQELLQEFVETLNTYTEISHSGEGYHLIAKYHGDKLQGCKSGDGSVEIYTEGRYIMITGNRLGATA